MSDELAGRELGGFRLIELLGQGAHGSVWRARQTRLDRDVAVKILDPGVARDPMAARRFEREGRAAASLDHPNVVPVFEAGEADGLVYLAMRLVAGETLEDRLADRGAVPLDEAVEYLTPVADALDHAHARGVVHRDVKPSNVLLDDGVWLADFGIAASVRDLGTYTAGVLGTAEYMAPEQANAGDVDHRADLYGLACVAYRALTGAPPYPGDDLISTLMSHVNDPIPSTGDEGLDSFFAVGLAKDPDDRFQSGADLVRALAAIAPSRQAGDSAGVASESTVAVSADTSTPSRRWMAVLATAVVAAVVGGLLLFGSGSGDSGETATTSTPSTQPPATDPPVSSTASSTAPAATSEPVVQPGPSELASGGTVEVGTTRSLLNIDPHRDRFVEPFITGNVLPPLMSINPDWSFSPWLAAAPPTVVSEDPLRVRWTLRSDAVWDDGTPITSSDVSATLDYINDPASGLAGTLLYAETSIEIVDDTTFELVFSSPSGAHAVLFSTIHPVIKAAAYEAHLAAGNGPDSFMADGIDFSGGPYMASGFDPGERLTLVRNDGWWGEASLLDRITIRRYDSPRDQLEALEVGELDLIYVEDARATDAARARSIDGAVVDVGVADQFLRLDMNTRRGHLSDVLVRQAVATSLDRVLITESAVTPITGEVVAPLNSLVWAEAQAQNTRPFDVYDGDAKAAEALLQDGGWELGDDGNRRKSGEVLEIELLFPEGSSLAEQSLVQAVITQLGDVGVRVVASIVDGDSLFGARITGEFDMVLVLDVVNTDPIAATFRFGSEYCPASFESDGCASTIATNLTGLSDDVVDGLLDDSSVEPDATQREALFAAADERLAELVPSLPLFELPTFVAHTDRLGGVVVDTHRGGPFAGLSGWGYVEEIDLR
ncbi:MAG: protein kinase [Actinomycetia bacterium]|nr:protein kinase [Actinomycetes bacterium]